jgi:hypothetical protein
MILRHATPARNLNSILRLGLLCSYSRGKLPVVWACSPARSSWAVLHVIRRHGGRVETTVVLEIDVPRPGSGRNRSGRCCGGARSPQWAQVKGQGEVRPFVTPATALSVVPHVAQNAVTFQVLPAPSQHGVFAKDVCQARGA